MGLFDFLRRKPEPPAGFDTEYEDSLKPRFVHYELAHAVLPRVAHQGPMDFLATFSSPDTARQAIRRAVRLIRTALPPDDAESAFPADDVRIHQRSVGGFPCVLLEMPTPLAVTEAHLVAVVLLVDTEKPAPDPVTARARYFTLEKGIRLGGPPCTVLCEWTADRTHRNYGAGPVPNLEAFLEAVNRRV